MIGELAPHPNPFVQPGTYEWTSSDTAMTDGAPHAMLKAQQEQTHALADSAKVRAHLRKHHGQRAINANPVAQHARIHNELLLSQGHRYGADGIDHTPDPGTSNFANAPARVIDLVRHVRTPEGAAFFKKPIGSAITEEEYQAIRAEREGQRISARHQVYGNRPVTITKVHRDATFVGTIHHPKYGDIKGVAFRPQDISSKIDSAPSESSSSRTPSHSDLLKARTEARKAYPAGHPERLKAERAVRQSRKTDEYRSAKGGGSAADDREEEALQEGRTPEQAKLARNAGKVPGTQADFERSLATVGGLRDGESHRFGQSSIKRVGNDYHATVGGVTRKYEKYYDDAVRAVMSGKHRSSSLPLDSRSQEEAEVAKAKPEDRAGIRSKYAKDRLAAAKKDPGFFAPAGRDEIGSGKGASPEQLRTEREANERNSLSPGKRAIYDVARKRRGESHADAMKRANSTSPPKLQEPHPDDEAHDDFQPKKRERTMSPREQITGLTPDQQRRYYAQRNAGISHERAVQNAARTPETGHTARKQEYQRLVAENDAQNHYLGGRSLARSEFENLTPGSHEVISGHLASAHAAEKSGKHQESGDHLAKAIDVAEQTNTRRTREMRRVLEERLHRTNSAKRETERQEVRTGSEAEAAAKKRDEQIARLNALWASARRRAKNARGPTAAQSAARSADEFARQLKELGAQIYAGYGWRHPDRRK